ncbi:flagellar basal body-associated FliL family protein [Natroniella sulfidigena]|uniref:flagellar basal body-associated FliL family protein n=1 Tax=Natroniella sulfidigena TaxID=723921 RepID=UPI00200AFA7A|nr:flagellar basal body-associated FliL family protein [Natroniella sulfidigena]MCK8816521.1 flagellar basal body-associated FliL family protein [Natroniella sulfidigena]
MSEDKKSGLNYSLILGILIAVVLATGISYFMMVNLGGFNQGEETEVSTTARELGPITEVGEFLVNLTGGRRFIRVNITVEVNEDDVVEEIDKRKPQIRDTIISILRSKEEEEVTSDQGAMEIRSEVMENINEKLLEGEVTNVFFTEFVIQ